MLKTCRDPDLALEPEPHRLGRQVRSDRLDRDLTVVLPVPREKHGAHPPDPEHILEFVSVTQRLA